MKCIFVAPFRISDTGYSIGYHKDTNPKPCLSGSKIKKSAKTVTTGCRENDSFVSKISLFSNFASKMAF